MQHVESYDGSLGPTIDFVDSRERPVGNIKWKSDLATRYTNDGDVNGLRWCTGTLIANDLLLTAGHCFDPDGSWPRVNATGLPISSQVGAQEMLVDFNYQNDPAGSPRPISTFEVVELVEHRLGSLDYAVIRLAGNPGQTFGRTVPSPFKLAVDEDVTIIQHPAGQLKKVHAGQVVSLGASTVNYGVVDTLGGSSGSGVLNERTSFLSAVHTNGGCLADGSGSNWGIQVAAIWSSSPTVKTRSFDVAKLSTLL